MSIGFSAAVETRTRPPPCGASTSSTCGTPPISCRRAARTAIDYEQPQEAAVATVIAFDPVAPRKLELRTPVLPSNARTWEFPPAPVPATMTPFAAETETPPVNDGAKGPNESKRALVAPEKTRITLAVPLPVAATTSDFPS